MCSSQGRGFCTCGYEACTGDLGREYTGDPAGIRDGNALISESRARFRSSYDGMWRHGLEDSGGFENRLGSCMYKGRGKVSVDLTVAVAVCRDILLLSAGRGLK